MIRVPASKLRVGDEVYRDITVLGVEPAGDMIRLTLRVGRCSYDDTVTFLTKPSNPLYVYRTPAEIKARAHG